jgi:hypothetical protein
MNASAFHNKYQDALSAGNNDSCRRNSNVLLKTSGMPLTYLDDASYLCWYEVAMSISKG